MGTNLPAADVLTENKCQRLRYELPAAALTNCGTPALHLPATCQNQGHNLRTAGQQCPPWAAAAVQATLSSGCTTVIARPAGALYVPCAAACQARSVLLHCRPECDKIQRLLVWSSR